MTNKVVLIMILEKVKEFFFDYGTLCDIEPFSVNKNVVFMEYSFAVNEKWFVEKLESNNYIVCTVVKIISDPVKNDDFQKVLKLYLEEFDDYEHNIRVNKLRVFIKTGVIVGISQIDFTIDCKLIENNYDLIINLCSELWDEIQEEVVFRTCVLDVSVKNTAEVQLVNIKPYYSWTGTGCCLFNWEYDPPDQNKFIIFDRN